MARQSIYRDLKEQEPPRPVPQEPSTPQPTASTLSTQGHGLGKTFSTHEGAESVRPSLGSSLFGAGINLFQGIGNAMVNGMQQHRDYKTGNIFNRAEADTASDPGVAPFLGGLPGDLLNPSRPQEHTDSNRNKLSQDIKGVNTDYNSFYPQMLRYPNLVGGVNNGLSRQNVPMEDESYGLISQNVQGVADGTVSQPAAHWSEAKHFFTQAEINRQSGKHEGNGYNYLGGVMNTAGAGVFGAAEAIGNSFQYMNQGMQQHQAYKTGKIFGQPQSFDTDE